MGHYNGKLRNRTHFVLLRRSFSNPRLRPSKNSLVLNPGLDICCDYGFDSHLVHRGTLRKLVQEANLFCKETISSVGTKTPAFIPRSDHYQPDRKKAPAFGSACGVVYRANLLGIGRDNT